MNDLLADLIYMPEESGIYLSRVICILPIIGEMNVKDLGRFLDMHSRRTLIVSCFPFGSLDDS